MTISSQESFFVSVLCEWLDKLRLRQSLWDQLNSGMRKSYGLTLSEVLRVLEYESDCKMGLEIGRSSVDTHFLDSMHIEILGCHR